MINSLLHSSSIAVSEWLLRQWRSLCTAVEFLFLRLWHDLFQWPNMSGWSVYTVGLSLSLCARLSVCLSVSLSHTQSLALQSARTHTHTSSPAVTQCLLLKVIEYPLWLSRKHDIQIRARVRLNQVCSPRREPAIHESRESGAGLQDQVFRRRARPHRQRYLRRLHRAGTGKHSSDD